MPRASNAGVDSMKKLFFLILVSAATAFAETSTTQVDLGATPEPAAAVNTSTSAAPESDLSSAVLKHMIAGWKSQNSTGRMDDLNSKDGRRTEAFQEVWLGYKNAGWGLYGLYANEYYAYGDTSKTRWAIQDPSVTINHPAWYVSDDLVVTGKFRRYFPLSGYSQAHEMVQSAYYVDAFYKMANRQDIYNNVTFRWFTYNNHGPSATRNYWEATTNYTKYFSKDFRWGFGHWTQYEHHYGTPNGLSVELGPMLEYAPSSKIFMGPRLRVPVVAQGVVYDGPTSASWNQAYIQFFLLANL
jgi:hypothetical protein